MSVLSELYIKTETLNQILKTLESKGEKGISLTISISDETNNFGQNLSSYVSQSKEEREEKKKRFYVGNGKVFWTDGTIKIAEKVENKSAINSSTDSDDLPF